MTANSASEAVSGIGNAWETPVAAENCITHDAKSEVANCNDLDEASEVSSGSAIVEEVARVAKLYAAGDPSAEELEALKQRLTAVGNEVKAEDHVVPVLRNEWPTAEKCLEIDREGSDFPAGLRALEESIRVIPRPSGFKNHRFAGNRSSNGRRTFRTLAPFFIAVLIGGAAAFAWQYHGDVANEMVRTRAPLLGWLLSLSTTKPSSAPASAAAATSFELARQLEAITSDLTAMRQKVGQLAGKQEQMSHNIATLQAVEQDSRTKTSSSPPESRAKSTPTPETRPTTLEGWTLREVTNGTAVLEGPNGIRRAKRGDTVPGVGRIASIIRWGGRWIVATSGGLISTP
jgi:hypothetical protein